jgi:hypothetical protein
MNTNVLLINPWIYDFAPMISGASHWGFYTWPASSEKIPLRAIDRLHESLSSRSRWGEHIKKPRRKAFGQGHYPKERIPKPEPLQDFPRNYYRYGITPYFQA